MKYNPDKHHRQSIRLQGYDYASAGAYFITICAYQRECLFGDIVDGEMQLNEYGKIVVGTYLWLATQYSYIDLDAWIIMPNHFHGILVLTDHSGEGVSRNAPTHLGQDVLRKACVIPETCGFERDNALPTDGMKRKSLGRLIGAFKTVSTKQINLFRDSPSAPVWQRNYYDHIIRNEKSLQYIRHYIHHNPLSWQRDQLHPGNPSKW